jgi:hypothetical protein
MTGVLALAMPPEHETLDLDAQGDAEGDGVGVGESDDDAHDADADNDNNSDGDARESGAAAGVNTSAGEWQPAGANAFLCYVVHLPDSVQDRLRDLSPSFRFAYGEATLNSYWANHCDHCGRLLGDHELHCEPEGAFVPLSETAAARIELLGIEEPFQAAADGYAFEPEFFSLMRRA